MFLPILLQIFNPPPPPPWHEKNKFWGPIGLTVTLWVAGIGFIFEKHVLAGHIMFCLVWPLGIFSLVLAINGLTQNRRLRTAGYIASVILMTILVCAAIAMTK